MSEIEEVQEQMKTNMKATKDQMAIMMEDIMSMKRMRDVNTATVIATSTATEVDPTHPSGLNQVNPPFLDMVGQGGEALGSRGGPCIVQVQNKHSFPAYGLPPNYTPPNVAHTPDENVDNSTPIPIGSQQPQSDHAHVSQPMGETHKAPQDHNLADFEPYHEYAVEGQAFCGVPLPNTLGGPQPPLNQPQHPPAPHPRPSTTPNTNQNTNQGRSFLEKKPVEFTTIPTPYADLLPYLLNNAMAIISPTKISQPPFPKGYNPNVTCVYHRGVPGHSIEHCMTLKHKVQSLIDAGWLRFEEENRS
ncbi:hypothetical protein HKD37_04G010407 [Glycine soja]